MKQFLIKAGAFFAVIILLNFLVYKLSIYALDQQKQNFLKLGKNVNCVFAGDSNIESAVNDSLISNSVNVAESGEAYLYTYEKLKSLLNYNAQIRYVFLGLSTQNLLKIVQDRWLFNTDFIIEGLMNYNYLLDDADKILIFRKNPKAFVRGICSSIYTNFKTSFTGFTAGKPDLKSIHFGGYQFLTRDKLQEDISRNSYLDQSEEKGYFQEKYLKKISTLCRKRSVRLVLLNTPKHTFYRAGLSKGIIENYVSVTKTLSGDSILDLSAMPMPDSCFSDLIHLNNKGAEFFSEYLNRMISSSENQGKKPNRTN
jgi:hypothetical protein